MVVFFSSEAIERGKSYANMRKTLGLSMTKLANLMCVSPGTVANAERGANVHRSYSAELERLYRLRTAAEAMAGGEEELSDALTLYNRLAADIASLYRLVKAQASAGKQSIDTVVERRRQLHALDLEARKARLALDAQAKATQDVRDVAAVAKDQQRETIGNLYARFAALVDQPARYRNLYTVVKQHTVPEDTYVHAFLDAMALKLLPSDHPLVTL